MAKAPKEKTKVIVKTSTRMSKKGPLTPDMLRKLDAYWRAANYLAAGQLYLLDNPLLREPLRPEHLKRTLVGHWGTVPGQNFIYTHLNRVITRHELNMIYVSGPGHGGNAVVAQTYLEGTYSEFYPNVSQDEEGVPPVLLPRRHRQPLRPRDPRLHQRGGRAGLLPGPRLWRGDGQPDPDRRLRSG